MVAQIILETRAPGSGATGTRVDDEQAHTYLRNFLRLTACEGDVGRVRGTRFLFGVFKTEGLFRLTS